MDVMIRDTWTAEEGRSLAWKNDAESYFMGVGAEKKLSH
jgi:hypothetical protein